MIHDNMTSKDFINAAFVILLSRDPDKNGMEYWLRKFAEGTTKDEFLSCLVSSAEFQNNKPGWLVNPILSKPDGLDVSDLIDRGMKIGNNCTIHFDTILDPSYCNLIEIGNNVTLAPRCYILAHDGSMKTALGYTKIGKVIIEDNVFIGAGSIILPNVHIGKNSIIGAGSVVTHTMPKNSVIAGNPAQVICTLEIFLEKHKNFINERMNDKIVEGFGYKQ
jgi:acetyltransferase-like isoleucine patch superfamily enzyme